MNSGEPLVISLLAVLPRQLSPAMQSLIVLTDPLCTVEQARQAIVFLKGADKLAIHHRVISLITSCWSELLEENLPADEFMIWRNSYLLALMTSQRQQVEIQALLPGLEATQPVVMRGCWLAQEVYDEPAQRPFLDIDLLIRDDLAQKAAEVLTALGYVEGRVGKSPYINQAASQAMNVGGLWTRTESHQNSIAIDLHTTFKISSAQWWPLRPTSETIWAASEVWNFGEAQVRMLTRPMQLIALCENIRRHSTGRAVHQEDRLIRYCDLRRFYPCLTDEDWEQFIEDCTRFGTAISFGLILEQAERFWPGAMPAWVLARLLKPYFAVLSSRYALRQIRFLGVHLSRALFEASSLGNLNLFTRYLWHNVGPALRYEIARSRGK